jgi:hypothetical protein
MKHKTIVLSVFLLLIPITVFAASWQTINTGNTKSLVAIWGSSANNVFAVGNVGTILQYNGNNWTSMDSGTTKSIWGVWGTSATNVYAVGGSQSSSTDGFILHYDGIAWSKIFDSGDVLYEIYGSSENNIYAVGGGGPYPGNAVIFHYDGTAWTKIHNGTNAFRCLWVSNDGKVYAGHVFGGIRFYDGTNWHESYGGSNIYGIWGSAWNDVYAVGHGTIIHYDGNQWSYLSVPGDKHGVWGNSATDVFLVGYSGYIYHYDGSNWSPMVSETTEMIPRAWGSSGNNVFGVLSSGNILHYGGASTVIDLSSLVATPSNEEVTINWSTESETDNAGFNLYRAESENGKYTKINATLIPAQGSSTQGASYEYIDKDVKNRKTYYYKLEDVDLNGSSTLHGPVNATPRWLFGIFGK